MSLPAHEIALLRLVAQRLAGPPLDTPLDVVRRLGAVQGQDLPGALVSIALRTAARSRADVEAAFAQAKIVRTWPMRGTLHVVPAADVGWMTALTAERQLFASRLRRVELGLDEAALDRARAVATAALAGGGLHRDEILAAFAAAGVPTAAGAGTHALGVLAQTGLICLGPLEGRKQRFVLVDEWVADLHRPDRDEALGLLAERFFRSHGPATVADLRRWTGLLAADVTTAVARARPQLESVGDHLLDPATPDLLAAHREEAEAVHLLPGFDELVLGYADRSQTLPPEHADRIVPGGNGVFRPTVVAAGTVVGTWRRKGKALEAEPFTRFPRGVGAAAKRRFAELP